METRRLGTTGLDATLLGFGAMELRGPRVWNGRDITDSEADMLLNAVLDAGIGFMDTAPAYGPCEEWIGRFVGHRRNEYLLATKCGSSLVNRGEHDDTPHDWTAAHIEHSLERSLRRLRTDRVDVWQLHNPSVRQVEEGSLLEVMYRAKAAGKVRAIGVSTTLPHVDTFLDWRVFDLVQLPFSLLQRDHAGVIERAGAAGAAVIVRGAVARGQPGAGQGSPGRWQAWEDMGLSELLEEGETPTMFMLRYVAGVPHVATVLVGTLDTIHLAQNVTAARQGALPAQTRREVERRLALLSAARPRIREDRRDVARS